MSRLSQLRRRLVTPDAVYGTVLFAALIATSSEADPDSDGIPGVETGVHLEIATQDRLDLVEVLLVSVTTLLVFWVAHVYARTIARHGRDTGFRDALREAIGHSNGMLWSAIPATLILVLGVIGIVPDAVDWALLVNVLVLGFLGYQSLSERGRPVWRRIIAGVLTAVLGVVIILIKVAVH
jgi:hypothetical protein